MSRMINLSYCQFLDILINALRLSHKNTRLYNRKKRKKTKEGKARMTHMCQLFLKSRFKVKVTLWHNIVKSCIKFIFWPNFITVLHLVSEIFNIKTKNRQSTFQAYPVTLTFGQGHHVSYV